MSTIGKLLKKYFQTNPDKELSTGEITDWIMEKYCSLCIENRNPSSSEADIFDQSFSQSAGVSGIQWRCRYFGDIRG